MLTGTILVPVIVAIGVLAVVAGLSDEAHRRAAVEEGHHA